VRRLTIDWLVVCLSVCLYGMKMVGNLIQQMIIRKEEDKVVGIIIIDPFFTPLTVFPLFHWSSGGVGCGGGDFLNQ